jgi:ferritin-like metal-binding protein YciE
MKSMDNLDNLLNLLQYQLKRVFDAESQLVQALPNFEKTASNIELKKLFTQHLKETKMHQDRMLGMGHDLNINLKGGTCRVMKKLISKTNEFCHINTNQNTKDAGLIAYVQRIEQCEIESYEYVIRYAKGLEYDHLAHQLRLNQTEESQAYEILNSLSRRTLKAKNRNYFVAYD